MSPSKPQICCSNPQCHAPLNPLGSVVCESCQTPLLYRYVWAVGTIAKQIPVETQVAGRYYVTAPQIWLDMQPSLPPEVPMDWSDTVLPYLHLYPQRLHVPEIYGFCPASDDRPAGEIFLLENVPLDESGLLYPAIGQAWSDASAVRQVYWLWQMLQLWTPLWEQGVASSLLAVSNLRVEGWRVRLCQLFDDAEVLPALESETAMELSLADVANLWSSWVAEAKPEIQRPLQTILHQMRTDTDPAIVAAQLNQLLLEQAAQLPLRLQIAGGSDTGPERSHNEDTCYPVTLSETVPADGLMPRLAIVCDGIGGHEGGEVASQLAVHSLKLQVQALMAEVAQQSEPVPPSLLMQQLEASVRVVNNLIAAHNDMQGREDRRRMGTTLVMALQLPQRVRTEDGTIADNGHELYLVHVGDSRAYWITPRYCHQLTVDDDVAAREVRLGRSLHWESLQRPDAGALTQAIGTRDADFLHPSIQRFIVEEDGILLLCSDGLSDNELVEQTWASYTDDIFRGKRSLESAVQAWIDLANQKNGYDNTSVVLLHCYMSLTVPDVSLPATPRAEAEWSPASRALVSEPIPSSPDQPVLTGGNRRSNRWRVLVGLLLLVLLGTGLGVAALYQFAPAEFQRLRERIVR